MVEIWENIKILGFEKLYMVSNLGRVKSLKRIINHPKKGKSLLKEKILKAKIDSTGYPRVILHFNKLSKTVRVHRLVAECFVDGHFNNAIVNHIDSNKTNNIYSNLEWTDKSGNQIHAIKNGKFRPPVMIGSSNVRSKKVINIITNKVFCSAKETSSYTGINYSYLVQMLNGRRKNKTNFKYVSAGELSEIEKIVKSVKF